MRVLETILVKQLMKPDHTRIHPNYSSMVNKFYPFHAQQSYLNCPGTYFYVFPVLPYITPFDFEGEANTGDSVQLTCYISKGDTPLHISWSLNGKPISSHGGISMIPIGGKTNLLTITSVQPEHAGNFTCTARNQAGVNTHNAVLYINGTTLFFC